MKKLIRKLINLLPLSLKYRLYRSLVQVPDTDLEMDQVVFKLAETREELEGAFALLHDSYVDVGLMKPDPSGLRVTSYHAIPSSVTLIGKAGAEVVATLTIIADSKLGLPSDQFVDLSKLRQGGNRLAEISALAIKKEYKGKLLFHLLKYNYEWCVNYLSINHLIATLTTDSKAYELYESILFFKRIENKIEANYAFANFRPVIAEHLDLDEARETFKKHYAKKETKKNLFDFFVQKKINFFQFPKRTHFAVSYPTMNSQDFTYFFTQKTSALLNMSTPALLELQTIYQGQPQADLINKTLLERNVLPMNRFQRKERFDVSFKTTGHSHQQIIPLRVLDISAGGLRVASQSKLDDRLEILIPTTDGQPYKIVARKAWQDSYGVSGLIIISADNHWHDMIQSFDNKTVFPLKRVRN